MIQKNSLILRLKTSKYFNLYFLLFLIGASILIYWRVFSLFFYQDDFDWLYQAWRFNQNFTTAFTYRMSNFFTPVINIYFMLAYKIFFLNPIYYHLANIVLHAINAYLFFYLLQKIGYKTQWAVVASVLFLVARYPVEAVVWIGAITILIFSFLLLLAGIAWINFLKTNQKFWYILTILSSLLVFITKEWAVLLTPFLAIIALLYNYKQEQKISKKLFLCFIPFVFLTLVYLIFEASVQKSSVLIANQMYGFGIHGFKNIISSVPLVFLPIINFAKAFSTFWLGASFAFAGVIVAFTFYYKKYDLFYWLVWLLIIFAPTSFFLRWQFVSRYGYLASMVAGIVLVIVADWAWGLSKKRLFRVIIVGTLCTWAVINIYLIQRMISLTYAPIYEYNKKITADLALIVDKLPTNRVYFYDNSILPYFLLSKISFIFYQKDLGKMYILTDEQSCPVGESCVKWDYLEKRLILLPQK